MRATLLLLLAAVLALADAEHPITCEDLKEIPLVGGFFVYLSSSFKEDVSVHVYASTSRRSDSIRITPIDWLELDQAQIDPTQKTYIIIHGFKSGGQKGWVLKLKDAILDKQPGNILMVDWSQGCNTKNYVAAARNTMEASKQLHTFLKSLRQHLKAMNPGIKESQYQWNKLHFIGHSLGSHISGQTATLLKNDKFWKIERITGLDPANPCFRNVDSSLRLDTQDADFVDIIHTQCGTGKSDSLGLKDNIGHVDFYVNGGMTQPECRGSWFTPMWKSMICSHKLAYKYFTESLLNSKSSQCTFAVQRWDGTYDDSQIRLKRIKDGSHCSDCPELGMDSIKSKLRGIFLAITGSKEPYCKFKTGDVDKVTKILKDLKDTTSIFTLQDPVVRYTDPNEVVANGDDGDYDTNL